MGACSSENTSKNTSKNHNENGIINSIQPVKLPLIPEEET